MRLKQLYAIIPLVALPVSLSPAIAQPASSAQPGEMQHGDMPGMNMQPGTTMPGMNRMPGGSMQPSNMRSMSQHCAQMRAQMQPGMAMTPQMSEQCAQADAQTKNNAGAAAAPEDQPR